MNRRFFSTAAALTLVTALAVAFAGAAGAKTNRVLAFDVMTPVVAPYTGATNPIRGINGGGVAWELVNGKGWLTAGGHLKVEVEGLVLASTHSNPIAAFKATVSCQTIVDGAAQVVNVATAVTFPATTGLASAGGGNADIEAQVALPQPCIAPIIFVTSGGGSWFAATGF
jgi:hypothetical protein